MEDNQLIELINEKFAPYEVQLLLKETSHEDLVAKDAELPSDTYLVRYVMPATNMVQERYCTSAFRAYKSVDIFDALHDQGCKVLEIRLGYGRIKPKLYQG